MRSTKRSFFSSADAGATAAFTDARRQARARRRAILKGLLAASGVTLILALGLGGSFFFLPGAVLGFA